MSCAGNSGVSCGNELQQRPVPLSLGNVALTPCFRVVYVVTQCEYAISLEATVVVLVRDVVMRSERVTLTGTHGRG